MGVCLVLYMHKSFIIRNGVAKRSFLKGNVLVLKVYHCYAKSLPFCVWMCHLRYCVVKLMDLLRINLFWKTRFRAENSSLNHLSRALFNTYQLNLLWWNGPGYCVFYEKVLSLLAFTRPIIESHVHFFLLHFFTLCKNTFFTHCVKTHFLHTVTK